MLLGCGVVRGDVRAVPGGGSGGEVPGDDEECALRDHLLAVHPNTVQPATLGVLLGQFVVNESR